MKRNNPNIKNKKVKNKMFLTIETPNIIFNYDPIFGLKSIIVDKNITKKAIVNIR